MESSQGEVTKGSLTVGVIPTIAPYLLPLLLRQLEKNHPNIELNILELQTERIKDALDNDEIDVGILALPLGVAKIIERSLYYEPFSILYRKGHDLGRLKKIKHSALKTDDIWLLQEGHCLRNQTLDICATRSRKDHKRKFNFESGSLETLKNIVGTYGGYTLLPAMATHNLGGGVELASFERPIPAREVGLVYRREHYKSELVDILAEAIMNAIPSEIRKIRPKDLEVVPI